MARDVRTGEPRASGSISARLRSLCEKSGFAENFDTETGNGLRDRAYTRTAATHLVFAGQYRGRAGA